MTPCGCRLSLVCPATSGCGGGSGQRSRLHADDCQQVQLPHTTVTVLLVLQINTVEAQRGSTCLKLGNSRTERLGLDFTGVFWFPRPSPAPGPRNAQKAGRPRIAAALSSQLGQEAASGLQAATAPENSSSLSGEALSPEAATLTDTGRQVCHRHMPFR